MTNDKTAEKSNYHHGDLRRVLIVSTADLIEVKGVNGFSVREVARQAGVSHSAPAHHFGDLRGLLTAVAIDGFDQLSKSLTQSIQKTKDPEQQLRQLGRTYVRVGLSLPGHFAVMFREDCIHHNNEELIRSGIESFNLLLETTIRFQDTYDLNLNTHMTAKLLWVTAQGLVSLHHGVPHLDEIQGEPATEPETTIDDLFTIQLNGLRPKK